MTAWRALVAGMAGLVTCGCSLLVATDGLSSSSTADAGPVTTDGGADASRNESGLDAAADGDSGPPLPFCASRSPQPTFDGRRALDGFPLEPALVAGRGAIEIGLVYVQVAAGRARAHIDDLTVDLR